MSNSGTFAGAPLTGAAASDPALCRVSGFLRNLHGEPLAGTAITLRHVYSPVGVHPTVAVLRERTTVRSDGTGYVAFDLYRGAKVDVGLPGLLVDFVCHCVVPDAASIDLTDFLFPFLETVEWEDAAPLLLDVGDASSVVLLGTLSNGEQVEITGGATIESGDTAVADVSGQTVSGLTAGSTTLTVTAVDSSALGLQMRPDGVGHSLFSVPAPTLPAARTVTVS